MAVDASKAFLKKTDANGVSVYSHLTEVLAQLLESQPSNALGAFESVSLKCKASHYAPGGMAAGPAPPELPDGPLASSALAALLAELAKPSEEEPAGVVSDVVGESKLFACAGVGLSPDETYKVFASLVKLQKDANLSSVRFFGKMLGCPTDYYVAEAKYIEPPAPEEDAPEPAADVEIDTGCNAYVYFAATDLAGTWTVLPNVTPQQIVGAKKIRKYLTGDLAADVRAYPPFPGKEKEYLRALVAQIVAATTLCPVGKYTLEEEATEPTEVEVGADEGMRALPDASALGDVKGWCTRYMGILDIGRCTNLPVEEEEGEEDKPKPYLQPEIKFLAPVSADEWTATTYSHGGPPIAIAKSLTWPGAICAYEKAKGPREVLSSLYIGYGLPALSKPFVMEAPPPFQEEPAEVHEQADMPLAEENKIFLAAKTEEIAAAAAELPDPEE